MLKFIGLAVCTLIMAVTLGVCGTTVAEIQDSYTCEELDGYDPKGMTAADRYPSGTWAGICENTKYGATVLQVVLMGVFTAIPGYAMVAILRQ